MYPPVLHRMAVPLAVAAAVAVASVATPAHARPEQNQIPAAAVAVPTNQVEAATDRLARQLARRLADPAVADWVTSAVVTGPVDLQTVDLGPEFARATRAANQSVAMAKGLPAAESLLQLRLAHPDMRAALERGQTPLVLGAVADDTAATVTAYDHRGAPVTLDATRLPDRPVLIVEVDVAEAMSIGLDLLRDELSAAGLSAAPATGQDGFRAEAASGYYATRVDAVRLNNDHEPWHKGGAEIFSIVGGFGLDGKPTVDIVDMPYLDHDGTTYYPYQVLIHWRSDKYKYNIADIVMMEDDGGTNYRSLATALINALAVIVDMGTYVPLVNAIIDAIPTEWWSDDPDYVDSWYTISTNTTGRRYGARGNGWMDFTRYWVAPL